ncbi:MAG: hypothetical protein Q7K65_02135 [Candidatus Buchananbacteria bacterium]|nr:hypothetical protein [Candidatus Buchananbacteria bacterium]
MLTKFLKFIKICQSDIILAITVVLISITAFNLGKISAFKQQKTPITITEPGDRVQGIGYSQKLENNSLNPKPSTLNPNSPVVASKNSTSKVYHFPWCSSASKIADKNKLTFTTEAAAISAGYTLAGNCTR